MNRYQIYLNPKSVETFDDLAQILGTSRTQVVRDAIDRVAHGYQKIISFAHRVRTKDNPLLKMAGFAKSPTGKVSENINEIYLKD